MTEPTTPILQVCVVLSRFLQYPTQLPQSCNPISNKITTHEIAWKISSESII